MFPPNADLSHLAGGGCPGAARLFASMIDQSFESQLCADQRPRRSCRAARLAMGQRPRRWTLRSTLWIADARRTCNQVSLDFKLEMPLCLIPK